MMLAWGILCAVLHARKSGEGQVIDAAITDGAAYLSSLLWVTHNAGQTHDEPGTSWVDGAAPWNDTYECQDGKYVTVCALEPQFYQEFLERLGLGGNPVFEKQWDRSSWQQGKAELRDLFLTKTRDEWSELLEGTDICFGPVMNFSEAPDHPHNVARNTFLDIEGVTQPAPAPKLSRYEPSIEAPPNPGEHSLEILRGMGFDEQGIADLGERGVV